MSSPATERVRNALVRLVGSHRWSVDGLLIRSVVSAAGLEGRTIHEIAYRLWCDPDGLGDDGDVVTYAGLVDCRVLAAAVAGRRPVDGNGRPWPGLVQLLGRDAWTYAIETCRVWPDPIWWPEHATGLLGLIDDIETEIDPVTVAAIRRDPMVGRRRAMEFWSEWKRKAARLVEEIVGSVSKDMSLGSLDSIHGRIRSFWTDLHDSMAAMMSPRP